MDCGPEAQACFGAVRVPHEYPPRSIGWYPVSVYSGERRVQIVPRRLRTILVRAGRESLRVPMPGRDTDLRRKEIQTHVERRHRPRRLRGIDQDGHEVQTKEIFLTLCAWYENLWRVKNTLSVVFLRIFDKFEAEAVRDTF